MFSVALVIAKTASLGGLFQFRCAWRECPVDAGIRRRDVGRWAFVLGKWFGEKSYSPRPSNVGALNKPFVTARDVVIRNPRGDLLSFGQRVE